MYLPPPGRPVSSPPSPETTYATARHRGRPRTYSEDVRRAIKADYEAGKRVNEIARERGMHKSSVHWILGYRPPSLKVVPNEKRGGWRIKDRETWEKNMAAGVAKSFKAEERKARKVCRSLNQGETRGAWMTPSQCVEAGLCQTRSAVEQRVKKHGWERRKWRDGSRIPIVLVPYSDKWGAALRPNTAVVVPPAPATDIAPAIVVAPPPPTLWQRIVGWFR